LLENFEALGVSIVSAFFKINLADLSLAVAVDFPATAELIPFILSPFLVSCFLFSIDIKKIS
jgi:hypothetical protein